MSLLSERRHATSGNTTFVEVLLSRTWRGQLLIVMNTYYLSTIVPVKKTIALQPALPGQSASDLEIETWSYNCPLGKSDIPRALKLSRLNRRVRHNAPSPWPFFFPLFFFFFSFSLFPFFPLRPFSSSSFFFFLHCPNPWHQRKETGDIEEDLDRDDLSHIHTAIIYPRATSSSLCKVRRIDKKGAYLISELSHPSSPG